jgi:type II secretory pathway pseudopilin PulG
MSVEITPIAIVIALAFAAASYALTRWLSSRGRARQCDKDRAAQRASETRQQRRARQRRERR